VTRRIGGGLVLLGLLLAVVLVSTGWSVVVLASPSMEPFASPGDLLVQRSVAAEDIVVGDVITVPAASDRLVTHRVVRLIPVEDGGVIARLKGDASPLTDPVPVRLQGEVTRVTSVVPMVGRVLTEQAALWGGLGLLVLGGGALIFTRRGGAPATAPAADQPATVAPGPAPAQRPAATPDPAPAQPPAATPVSAAPSYESRVAALLATCEQFTDDGLPDVMLRDLVRVRVAGLLGLPPAEHAGVVHMLDDGARFYVVALEDADPAALALVPPGSERRHQASAALEAWWQVVGRRVPDDVAEQIAPLLSH